MYFMLVFQLINRHCMDLPERLMIRTVPNRTAHPPNSIFSAETFYLCVLTCVVVCVCYVWVCVLSLYKEYTYILISRDSQATYCFKVI